MLIDLVNEVETDLGLASQTLNAAAAGAAVDGSNHQASIGAIVNFGTPGAGQTTATVQIEECATTNGTWTQIPGMVTTLTGTQGGVVVLRGLQTQQYVRANAITVAGTTPSLPCGVVILSQRRFAPQGSGVSTYPD